MVITQIKGGVHMAQRGVMRKGVKKMTENEILKALKICHDYSNCDGCQYGKFRTKKGLCVDMLHKDSADLINRQTAEVKALNEVADKLASENSKLKEELKSIAEVSREEAIQDFADSLKYHLNWATEPIDEYDIDNLVKEMVGAENG